MYNTNSNTGGLLVLILIRSVYVWSLFARIKDAWIGRKKGCGDVAADMNIVSYETQALGPIPKYRPVGSWNLNIAVRTVKVPKVHMMQASSHHK